VPTPAPKPVTKPAPQPGKPTTRPVPRPVGRPIVHERILNGRAANDAPWAAQVSWDGVGYQCSGSLVAPSWVLTAQHCVNKGGMSVQVGSPKLGDGTRVTVDGKKVDPSGDMALLHLSKAVEEPTVALADADPEVGSINAILGWGKTSPDSGPSADLKSARVRVTGVDCTDAFGGKAICSTAVTGSAFNGDSGGPEMSGDVQVGVCSTGEANGSQQYASVAANRDWIREVAQV
jgi:secreted trypsin-like serine protease